MPLVKVIKEKMTTVNIHQNDPYYLQSLKKHLTDKAPAAITAIGNINILQSKTLALFCSVKCPGNIILKTYDLMKKMRESGTTVISGFHSPMEHECLNILLKGKQPVINSPARSIGGMRIKTEYKKPLEEGRLLILSSFSKKEKRISSERSLFRNFFVAAIADSIFIPYASPNSKTERFCSKLLTWNKPIYTFEDNVNKDLLSQGIRNIKDSIFWKTL